LSPSPWAWVPSLYLVQGLPYVLVLTTSVIMYKRLGLSNAEVALATSWLYLPWVIKPLWSPLVEVIGTRRGWVLAMQGAMGALFAALAFLLPLPFGVQASFALLWLVAFASATHDIAADGLYMLGLDDRDQARFVGVRSTFWRLAVLVGEGPLVVLAGVLENRFEERFAWAATIGVLAVLFSTVFLLHLWVLPRPPADVAPTGVTPSEALRTFGRVFARFFQKPHIVGALAFLLLYRLAEAQLLKMIPPFLLDPVTVGGLGLSTEEVGFAKGTLGVIALLGGGIAGGLAIARWGLARCLWPMVLILHLPDLVFVALAVAQPESYALVCAAVAVEQLGYGFGFTAYTMFLIRLSAGEHRTAHYAIGTGFMALGMMLPGMWSGALQEALGYPLFFTWVALCTLPGFAVVALARRWLEEPELTP
jgi:PAT family beta-lactamase induction signal transducer AmpG